MVAKPSPPEICWHLIAPFTAVALVYAGSALLLAAVGWVRVLVGHCTWNDCAAAGSATRASKVAAMPPPIRRMLIINCLRPELLARTAFKSPVMRTIHAPALLRQLRGRVPRREPGDRRLMRCGVSFRCLIR